MQAASLYHIFPSSNVHIVSSIVVSSRVHQLINISFMKPSLYFNFCYYIRLYLRGYPFEDIKDEKIQYYSRICREEMNLEMETHFIPIYNETYNTRLG
jgi:hypothetical protein